ncbi:MAG: cyclase family protein [Thermoclostridium sp.]|nr:cyclase family protein [Thermoclostridium sp.]
MKIVDITRPVISNMTVWPGDEGVLLERTASISKGSMVNVSRLHIGVHTGTHVDAPAHFIDGGKSIDELDVQLFSGWVRVVDVRHVNSIQPEHIYNLPGEKNEAVFFQTSYSEKTLEEPFDTEFTGLSFEAASCLLAQGVRVIGTDALSIEAYNSKEFPVHYALLGNEVLIVEGLCLKEIAPGRYRYVCMPLSLKGSDGSPARVVLFEDENE